MKTQNKISGINISGFVIRLILAFLIVSSLFFIIGPFYIKIFLPLFSYEIELINSEYEILEADLVNSNKIEQIQYKIRTHRKFIDEQGISWPSSDMTVIINSYAVYIHPIIIFSLILAWPTLSIKNKLVSVMISVPLLIAIELIDIPIHLIYKLQESYNIDSLSFHIQIPWYHKYWFNLLNTGGRQFLALLVFIISIAPHYLIHKNK